MLPFAPFPRFPPTPSPSSSLSFTFAFLVFVAPVSADDVARLRVLVGERLRPLRVVEAPERVSGMVVVCGGGVRWWWLMVMVVVVDVVVDSEQRGT